MTSASGTKAGHLVAADAVLVRVGLGEEVEAVLGEGELVVRNMVCMFSFSPSSAFMVAAAPSVVRGTHSQKSDSSKDSSKDSSPL